MKKDRWPVIAVLACMLAAVLFYHFNRNVLLSVTLLSPRNTAMYDQVRLTLGKPAPVYIEYTEVPTGKRFRTRTSPSDTTHTLDLLLLKANTEYKYRIYIGKYLQERSREMSFRTREQSPWLENHRHDKTRHPHDSTALGDGMILLCYGRLPGYMTLIDVEGDMRWYWQIDDIGVRAASITPRGTILALLRPFVKDMVDDYTMTPEEVKKDEKKKPMRRGSIGFAGGTGLAEVSLTGDLLWRLDLRETMEEKDLQVIHHDMIMDEDCHIHTLYRPKKVADIVVNGKLQTDTLGGDGIMVIDTLGNVIRKWSAWDVWDIEEDEYISEYRYDRFHINGMCMDDEGNYYLSAPIEDQIWKVDGKTGKLKWRFGRAGDFEMDEKDYFSFQHSPCFTEDGDLMLFDNGLYDQLSGGMAFRLDEENLKAEKTVDAHLPQRLYTSRMGSCYELPNGNLLQCSSKTGQVAVTDREGNVLWECFLAYAPYRAIYVPMSTFERYFKEIK